MRPIKAGLETTRLEVGPIQRQKCKATNKWCLPNKEQKPERRAARTAKVAEKMDSKVERYVAIKVPKYRSWRTAVTQSGGPGDGASENPS